MQTYHKELHFNNVSFEYQNSSKPIFSKLNTCFGNEWTGIVGSNGSGKTTLLKLAANKLKPTEGDVKSNGYIIYCEQRTDNLPENYLDFINSYEKKSFKLQDLLEIESQMFLRWDSLSHGERKRCQIATALFFEPDILIIDEPTNHIDSHCKRILIESLKMFKGIGLIVSHDRELLNQICGSILELKEDEYCIIKGNYDIYEQEAEKKFKNLVNTKDNMVKEIKKLEREVNRRKIKASQSDKLLSKKNVSAKDFDTKSKIDAARLTGKDGVDNKKYAQLKSRMENIISKKDEVGSTAKRELGIRFENIQYKKNDILFLKEKKIRLSIDKTLSYPDILISKTDKIGIVGINGSGKSSLIKLIVKELSKKGIDFSYIPQEISIENSKLLLKRTRNLSSDSKGMIFTIISRLNSDPRRLLDSELPSPGEVRKLMLANSILEQKSLIIMDEPTNHMDLPSIMCVEDTLREFIGALILVSHDKIFLNNIINTKWTIDKKKNGMFNLSIK